MTKHNVKHANITWNTKIQQYKTFSGTRKSKRHKTKVEHDKSAAKTQSEKRIQQHETQSETLGSSSTQHNVKHENPFVIQPSQMLDKSN